MSNNPHDRHGVTRRVFWRVVLACTCWFECGFFLAKGDVVWWVFTLAIGLWGILPLAISAAREANEKEGPQSAISPDCSTKT
jgi:hypothetical protein